MIPFSDLKDMSIPGCEWDIHNSQFIQQFTMVTNQHRPWGGNIRRPAGGVQDLEICRVSGQKMFQLTGYSELWLAYKVRWGCLKSPGIQVGLWQMRLLQDRSNSSPKENHSHLTGSAERGGEPAVTPTSATNLAIH